MKEYHKKEIEEFGKRIANYNEKTLRRILIVYKESDIKQREKLYKLSSSESEINHLKSIISDLEVSQSIHKRRNKELRLKIRNLESKIKEYEARGV